MRALDDGDPGSAWAQVELEPDGGVWICLWPDTPHMRQHIEVNPAEALDLADILTKVAVMSRTGYDLT